MGKKFNKEAAVNTVKKVGAIASSTGSVALICGVARAILPPGVNVIVSGAITLGGTILGGFIGDQLTDYVDKQIDTMIEEGKETVKQIKHDLDVIQDKDTNKNNPKEELVGFTPAPLFSFDIIREEKIQWLKLTWTI